MKGCSMFREESRTLRPVEFELSDRLLDDIRWTGGPEDRGPEDRGFRQTWSC